MENATINDISDIALWLAAFKAQESENSNTQFKDTLAKKLAGARGYKILGATPNKKAIGTEMIIRTSAIDRLIEIALAQGVDTVINLGAGLDTRPYRMKLPQGLWWVEVDMPGVIAYKNEQLSRETPVCDLHRIAADLTDDTERNRLFDSLGASSRNALVITEGLINHLTNDQATGLSQSICRIPSFRFWITDYSQNKYHRHKPITEPGKKTVNTHLKFDQNNPVHFFEQDGWKVNENISIMDEAKRVGRKFPLIFPWNLLTHISQRVRKAANNANGYVLFEK